MKNKIMKVSKRQINNCDCRCKEYGLYRNLGRSNIKLCECQMKIE